MTKITQNSSPRISTPPKLEVPIEDSVHGTRVWSNRRVSRGYRLVKFIEAMVVHLSMPSPLVFTNAHPVEFLRFRFLFAMYIFALTSVWTSTIT